MSSIRDDELADIIKEFLVEAKEHLDSFERAILEVEEDFRAEGGIAHLFRSIHSIKGSCGFLGFQKLESVAHAGESLLAYARDGRVQLDGHAVKVLLTLVDVIRKLLRSIEEQGSEGDLEVDEIVSMLESLRHGSMRSAPESPSSSVPNGQQDELRPIADSRIRVDVAVLDRLMNLVGELVLARNQVVQQSTSSSGIHGVAPLQRLNFVTTELQEVVMKARMQPIGHLWSRFPRMVRDLATASGKEVRLRLEGSETELDRSILEAIFDPLTHLIRNAVDHGIETVEQRRALGKSPTGTLVLRAFHEGGMVNIEMTDDGGGIDVELVKRRAVERNWAPADRAQRMTNSDAFDLLFLPGFTTSDRVTTVSGRGVGMDVVRTNVEKSGGTVELQSELGKGTTVRIKIPLTLAIIPALIVESIGERFAIPQASLLEVVRLEDSEYEDRIERIQGVSVLRLRGKLLPLMDLGEELGAKRSRATQTSSTVVVLRADQRTFGLVVDEIRDTQEIVVKPLWKRLKNLSIYAGATVMGDGRVVLILDSIGLAQRIGMALDSRQRPTLEDVATSRIASDEKLVLLCRLGAEGRLAIPLDRVARLEELSKTEIETVGGRAYVQYRGKILPLVHVSHLITERRARRRGPANVETEPSPNVQLVVFVHEGRSIGLIVDAIVDIISVELALERTRSRPGVLGAMVVANRITEFLDVERVVAFGDAGTQLVEKAAE
jgi:two-component system chemotaxis sensor kinase CheA